MRCPHCNCPIVKDGGCLKMLCALCKTSFMWPVAPDRATTFARPGRLFNSTTRPDLPSAMMLYRKGDSALINKLMSFYFNDYYR